MIDSQTLTLSGAASAAASPSVQSAGALLDKDDFLRLLITQLRHQNPLNPLDQNQFLSQAAQFTSLEQLQNISKALEDLKAASAGASLTQAAALLGKTVVASGRDFQFDGVTPASLTFALDASAGQVSVDILDGSGNLLRRLEAGARDAGTHTVEWDGLDSAGRRVTSGAYFYRVSASAGAGGSVPVAAAAVGALTGLQTQGGRLLYRMGSALVRQEDIVEVQ